MKKIFLYTFFLSIVFTKSNFDFNQNYTWSKKNAIDYDSLYSLSTALIDEDKVPTSIQILNKIISNSKDKALILNSYYDLGQIFLSRYSDYDEAIKYFNIILNNSFSYRIKDSSNIRSFSEVKEKSLFMIAYIYHNHNGNLTQAQKYYNLFLKQYPHSELNSSVSYELEIIDSLIQDFNKQIKSN